MKKSQMKKLEEDLKSDPKEETLHDFGMRLLRTHGADAVLDFLVEKLEKASDIEGYKETFDYSHKNLYMVLENLVQRPIFTQCFKSIKIDGYKRTIEFVNGSELAYIGGE